MIIRTMYEEETASEARGRENSGGGASKAPLSRVSGTRLGVRWVLRMRWESSPQLALIGIFSASVAAHPAPVAVHLVATMIARKQKLKLKQTMTRPPIPPLL